MVEAELYLRRFNLVGGWLCLDFSNTIARYFVTGPDERLRSYGMLVSWCWQAGLFSEEEAKVLVRKAADRSAEAITVHGRALTLRETIHDIFVAIAHQRQPEAADLEHLNRFLAEAMAHAAIVPSAGGFVWGWRGIEDTLDWVLWPVVRSAADLLTSAELHRVRECAGDHCGWLFLDRSKNQNRRWCETEICGNRARVRRHYQRIHQR